MPNFIDSFRDFFLKIPFWGKLFGAFFGFLIAGPAGALFGILIGNFFDRGLVSHFSRLHWLYHNEKRDAVRKVFFETTFAVMGHIAKSDGRVSSQEIQMALNVMDEMRLNRQQKTLAKTYFQEGKKPSFQLNERLKILRQSCADNHDLLMLFMDIQYRVALSEGLNAAKIKTLNEIFTLLGFSPLFQQFRFYQDFGFNQGRSHSSESHQQGQGSQQSSSSHYYYQASNSLAQAYAILEVNSNASKQEIKRAYRRLMSRNHPDKLISQGLPEEMIKIANDKTQKIRKAYELICESKGW